MDERTPPELTAGLAIPLLQSSLHTDASRSRSSMRNPGSFMASALVLAIAARALPAQQFEGVMKFVVQKDGEDAPDSVTQFTKGSTMRLEFASQPGAPAKQRSWPGRSASCGTSPEPVMTAIPSRATRACEGRRIHGRPHVAQLFKFKK
jgi:hypothetical protein